MVAWFIVVLAVILLSIAYVVYNYINIKKLGEGTPEMAELAGIIRSGARVFIRTEFRTVAIVVVIVALVFSLFVEKTSGITFIIGALMSSIVCILGMRSATYANVRTANKAMESRSIGETVKVVNLTGEGPVKRRIMDMGITKGTEVFVRKVAPLGDPMEVTVRGYELSLRKADTEMIEVQ